MVHHFFPKLVELHNYSPANALNQKLYNWNTLNQKVLRKLGYLVADEAIQGVINNKTGYAEWVLNELKGKIELYAAQRAGPNVANAMTATMMNTNPMMMKNGMANPMMMMMDPMIMMQQNSLGMGGMMNPSYGNPTSTPVNPHYVYPYPPALPNVPAPMNAPSIPPAATQSPTKSSVNGVAAASQPQGRSKQQSSSKGDGQTMNELQETIQVRLAQIVDNVFFW